MHTAGYMIMPPTKSRGHKLADHAQLISKSFVRAFNSGNTEEMIVYSERGWRSLIELFSYFRTEQDNKRISDTLMGAATARIVEKVGIDYINSALTNKRVSKYPDTKDASLRVTLNKIAHCDTSRSAFRIAKTGAHYLILTGAEQKAANGFWVIEIHMAKLCNRCREAAG